MLELLSLLFGGILRIVPSILEYVDAKNKRQHEREMVALQIEADKVRSELRQQETETKALGDASAAQTNRSFIPTGRAWIDIFLALVEAVNATVRPVLTYFYCLLLYGGYKVALFVTMTDQGGSWKDAALALWTSADYSVMLSIISFWFVDRALRKMSIK